MGFDRIRIKENAKTHYGLNKWNNVLVILISSAISGISSGVSNSVSSTSGEGDEASLAMAFIALIVSVIGLLLSIFLVNVVTMGATIWFQKSIHREKLDIGEMFTCFKVNYMDNVLMMFLKGLYISLWSLLFIVPGIVKSYAYRMAEFIKGENPNIPANRAIELSKIMTDGHKGDLFVLDLSFIGWNLLSLFTCGILSIVYVGPYYNAAIAFAYEELKAEAIASGKISAEELGGNGEVYMN